MHTTTLQTRPTPASQTAGAAAAAVPAHVVVEEFLEATQPKLSSVLLPGERMFAKGVLGAARRCQRLLNYGWDSSAPALMPLVEAPIARWLTLARAQAAAAPAPVTFAEHEARLLPLTWAAAMSMVTAYASILGWACMPTLMAIAVYAAL